MSETPIEHQDAPAVDTPNLERRSLVFDALGGAMIVYGAEAVGRVVVDKARGWATREPDAGDAAASMIAAGEAASEEPGRYLG